MRVCLLTLSRPVGLALVCRWGTAPPTRRCRSYVSASLADDAVAVTVDVPVVLGVAALVVNVIVNLGTGAQVIDPRSSGDVLVSENGTGWPVTHTYDDCTGGRYTMVAAQNGGLAVGWALQRMGIDWTRFAELASRATPGADGVLFSPFVTRERGALRSRPTLGPGWTAPPGQDPTEVADARAVAEAQVFLVRRSMEIAQVTPARVLLAGGGGRDHWVRQLLADVLDVPVHYLSVRSAAAAGAVVLAGGPALLQTGQSTAAGLIEPRPMPALEDAYYRWREHCYGASV